MLTLQRLEAQSVEQREEGVGQAQQRERGGGMRTGRGTPRGAALGSTAVFEGQTNTRAEGSRWVGRTAVH
jgi:hypothetical protein